MLNVVFIEIIMHELKIQMQYFLVIHFMKFGKVAPKWIYIMWILTINISWVVYDVFEKSMRRRYATYDDCKQLVSNLLSILRVFPILHDFLWIVYFNILWYQVK
jgi:hypothetical protein